MVPTGAFAQGSIFGTVQNADLSNPAVGQLLWVGFLDNTDEEIRIESNVGAGYDGTNWFDDFQNYTTEAAGNPYDFIFVNTANGQYFRLEKPIPSNSFQQENILLATASGPARPTGLTARVASLARINLSWNRVAGVTYHVYRRATANNSVFRRLDDPLGNLANAGVADSFFVDATSDGVTNYTYLIIGQDAGAIFSAHSVEVAADAATPTAPTLLAVDPDSGSAVNQPTVTIHGTNFDVAGMTVLFGGSPATNVVVTSPFQLTCRVPVGAPGFVDVVVTNTASGLSSAPLVNGFRYLSNHAPVLATIGPQSVSEGQNLNFGVSASDIDADSISLAAENAPANATFTDNGNGTGTFDFNPDYTQFGVYNVRFIAGDGSLADTEIVAITVSDVNRAPILATIGPKSVDEGQNLNFGVSASDPDGPAPTLTAENVPANATFIDNGAGAGTFNFDPDFTQAGVFNVRFIAFDGALADTEIVAVTVNNVNRAPVLAAIGPQSINEGLLLNVGVSATDPDGNAPTLTAENVPTNANFVDNGNGTGTFTFGPDFTQSGAYNVRFIASDGALADSELVAVTVNDVNQAPVWTTIPPQLVSEGQNLNFGVSATDPDGPIPALTVVNLPTNATFTDNGNGTGTFNFNPDFTQSGVYHPQFIASDGLLADTEFVTITVNETGNQQPVLAAIGPQSVNEGLNLSFGVSGTDPDADSVILSAEDLPANAQFIDNFNGTGSFNFDPDFTQAGVYNVRFIASDGLLADSEIVAVTVNDINRPPVLAAIGPQSVTEAQNLFFLVSASDVDGTIPALTAQGLPAGAIFTDQGTGTGSFNFTPDYSQVGVYPVLFIASDGTAADSETVDITVIDAGNQRPVLAAIGPKVVTEGTSLQFRVFASDSDLTIPTLTAVGVPPNATFADSLNGAGGFVFNPDLNQGGNAYAVTFIASDGLLADSELVYITVVEIGNLPPVFDSVPPPNVSEGDTLVVLVHAVDPEGGAILMGTLNPIPNAVFVDSGNGYGTWRYTPGYLDAGVDTVRIMALDNGAPIAAATLSFIVTTLEKNLAPNLWHIGDRTVLAGDSIKIRIVATDSTAPPGNQLFMAALNLPANATYQDSGGGIGKFKFKPTTGQVGPHTITFLVTDNGTPNLADLETITITVQSQNQAPVLAAIGPKSVDEGDTLVFGISATDPDGTIPILTASTVPTNAVFVDSGNGRGSLTFMPTYVQAGLYQVNFVASDGLLTDHENVLIQVREAGNQPPVLATLPDSASVVETTTLLILVSATDPEDQTLTLSVAPLLENSAFTDSGNGRGLFQMTPDYWQDTIYTLTILATDDLGGADTGFVVITIVDAGNQTPVVAAVSPYTVIEKDILTFMVTASDPDRTTPSLAARPLPPHASFIDNGDGTGTFSMTPDYPDAGVYTVYFVASDAELPSLQDSIAGTITVLDRTRLPVLDASSTNDQAVVLRQGDSVTIWHHAYDPDGPIPVMSATNLTSTYMTWADSGNGYVYVQYKPAFSELTGTYYATIVARDRDYDTVFVTKIQAFIVGPQNVPPVLDPIGPKSVMENDSLVFIVSATDPNGTTPTMTATDLPPNATFTALGGGLGRFRFLPTYNQAGVYYPLFRAADATTSDTERVAITVIEAGNQAPVWVSSFPTDTVRIAKASADTLHMWATDVDNAALTLLAVNAPPMSVFVDSLNKAGSFIFSPDSTLVGQVYDVLFIAQDTSKADTAIVIYKVISYIRGDWNYDGIIDLLDVVMQTNYTFRGGPPPEPFELGNYNGDTVITVLDLVLMIDYVFRNGPPLPP
ncbi:MAG: Ig-like domain-containing protein [Candidatus Zixiibacteriota bacterium]